MAYFPTTQAFYVCMGALFDELQRNNPKATRGIERGRMTIRFSCHDPEGIINIDGGQRPPAVTYGPTWHAVDLDIGLSADTLHHIMLGQQGIRNAMSSNLMRVDGSIFKALTLADLFTQAQKIYPDIIAQYGPR
jgi:hypothetical protein